MENRMNKLEEKVSNLEHQLNQKDVSALEEIIRMEKQRPKLTTALFIFFCCFFGGMLVMILMTVASSWLR